MTAFQGEQTTSVERISARHIAPDITGRLALSTSEDAESHRWRLVMFGIVSFLAIYVLLRPFLLHVSGGDHYYYLADSLLHGRFTIDGFPSTYPDYVLWQGHKYLPLGPLPAVILVPFLPLANLVADHDFPLPAYLLTILNIWLMAGILTRIGIEGARKNWSLLLFFGGSVYFWQVAHGGSYYLAHILTTTCLLAAIWETLGKRRPFLIGLFLGLAGMTRFTALFTLPFFVWMLWRGSPTTTEGGAHAFTPALVSRHLSAFSLLAVGLAGPVLALLAYNYVRFGSPLESGYGLAVLGDPALTAARNQGLFSLVHVPKNLYMMLLQGPLPYPSENAGVLQFPYFRPSAWGMSIFFTSPALLYSFTGLRTRSRSVLWQACWLGILSALVPILTYYGIGYKQFGYRYALDFMPLLILVTALSLPEVMTNRVRALVLAGVAVVVWGSTFALLWGLW